MAIGACVCLQNIRVEFLRGWSVLELLKMVKITSLVCVRCRFAGQILWTVNSPTSL